MAESMVRFGYIKSSQIIKAIDNGLLEKWSVVFTEDTHNIYLIDDNLNPIEIRSRIPIFNDIEEAKNYIKESKNIQTGELVCIKNGELYKAYVVTILNDDDVDITPVHTDQDFNYDVLENSPILNKTGTKTNPISLNSLPVGIYKVNGTFITPDEQTITSITGNLIFIDNFEIIRINNSNIIRYKKGDESIVEEFITDEYLKKHGYITEEDVNTKLTALNIITQDNIEQYVQTVFDTLISNKISNEITNRIATEQEIVGLF